VTIPGGIQGDQATAAIMVNCLPTIVRSRAAGLLCMRDMPFLPYYNKSRFPPKEANIRREMMD